MQTGDDEGRCGLGRKGFNVGPGEVDVEKEEEGAEAGYGGLRGREGALGVGQGEIIRGRNVRQVHHPRAQVD